MELASLNRQAVPASLSRKHAIAPLKISKQLPFVPHRHRRRGFLVQAGDQDSSKGGRLGGFNLGTLKIRVGPNGGQQGDTRKISTGSPGTVKLTRGFPGTLRWQAGQKPAGVKDANTVFVAGATGRLGARIVRELLTKGFKVRAGARDVEKAETWKAAATQVGLLTTDQAKRLSIVEFDLEDLDSIAPAIGNASRVVCAVGAPESEVLNVSAPKRIDGEGTIALVQQADKCGVKQFVLITSLGTGKWGWPAGALNLFWGVLSFKRQAESALERSSMAYTIVRPGGMERPTDNYKETHNLVLLPRDSVFGGQVSRLQVAELVAAVIEDPDASQNKCLEVIAEIDAPLRPIQGLLIQQQTEISQEERLTARAAVQAAEEKLSEYQSASDETVATVEELSTSLKALRQQEAAVRKEQAAVIAAAEKVQQQLDSLAEVAESARREEAAAKAVLAAAEKAGREGRLLTKQEISQIATPILNPQQQETARAFSIPFFGQTQVQEEVEEEEQVEQVTPQQQKGLFALFNKQPQQQQEVEEEEEEVAEVEEKPAQRRKGLFGGFGVPQAPQQAPSATGQQVEEEIKEEQVAEVVPAATSAGPAVAGFGGFRLPFGLAAQQDGKESSPAAPDVQANTTANSTSTKVIQQQSRPDAAIKKQAIPVATATPAAARPPRSIQPAAALASSSNGNGAAMRDEVPINVQEARQWIAAWKERTAKANSRSFIPAFRLFS